MTLNILSTRTITHNGVTVRLDRVFDNDADSSYLHDSALYVDCTEAERAQYVAEDTARLRGLERGDWHYIGIVATVVVEATYRQSGTHVSADVGTDAVWGIESDSPEAQLQEVETDCADNAVAEARLLYAALGAALAVPASQ